MNSVSAAGFDPFFDEHYAEVVDLLTEIYGSATIGRATARSAFASAYRFWSKIVPYDDPLEWALHDALELARGGWTNDAAGATNPTVGDVAEAMLRSGYSDAQIRSAVDLPDLPSHPPLTPGRTLPRGVEMNVAHERRLVIALAWRRRVIAAVVLGALGVVTFGVEIMARR